MLAPRSLSLLVTAVTLTFALAGCSVQKIAKSATEGSAEALEERTGKKASTPVAGLVSSTLDDPQVKRSVRDLAAEGVAGATPHLAPAVRTIIQGSLRGGAEAVQAPVGQQQLDEISRAVTLSASRSIAEALASQEPGALTPAVGGLVRTATREAVEGAAEALRGRDPTADPAQREVISRVGVALGEGMGPGLVRGLAHERGLMAVLVAIAGAMGLLASVAFYALWKQNQATAAALRLLAERVGGAPVAPPPSRRMSLPPGATPQPA